MKIYENKKYKTFRGGFYKSPKLDVLVFKCDNIKSLSERVNFKNFKNSYTLPKV